jgi:hypothetical protein
MSFPGAYVDFERTTRRYVTQHSRGGWTVDDGYLGELQVETTSIRKFNA